MKKMTFMPCWTYNYCTQSNGTIGLVSRWQRSQYVLDRHGNCYR